MIRDLDPRTHEDEVLQFFRELILPKDVKVNPIRINSAYKIQDYDRKLQEVNKIRNQVKIRAAKEMGSIKAAFLARQAEGSTGKPASSETSTHPTGVGSLKVGIKPNQVDMTAAKDWSIKESDYSPEYTQLIVLLEQKNKEVGTA